MQEYLGTEGVVREIEITLGDLITALQDICEDDDLVVATAVHMLRQRNAEEAEALAACC